MFPPLFPTTTIFKQAKDVIEKGFLGGMCPANFWQGRGKFFGPRLFKKGKKFKKVIKSKKNKTEKKGFWEKKKHGI